MYFEVILKIVLFCFDIVLTVITNKCISNPDVNICVDIVKTIVFNLGEIVILKIHSNRKNRVYDEEMVLGFTTQSVYLYEN